MRVARLGILLLTGLTALPALAADATELTQAHQGMTDNPVAMVLLDQLAATRQRPLFTPERHPPLAAPVALPVALPPSPPAAPPQVSLLGVIVDENGPRAMVRSAPAGKMLAVRLGDELAGWRVTEIEDRRLVISLEDRSVAVKLFGGDHGGLPLPIVHPSDRVLEVNAAGVLRSHRIPHKH